MTASTDVRFRRLADHCWMEENFTDTTTTSKTECIPVSLFLSCNPCCNFYCWKCCCCFMMLCVSIVSVMIFVSVAWQEQIVKKTIVQSFNARIIMF